MLSEKIYQLRRQASLSQEELAGRIGVSRQTISKWELGTATPELEKLVALSDCFGVSLDELVRGTPPQARAGDERPRAESRPGAGGTGRRLGWLLCLTGSLCLLLMGALALFRPGRVEELNASSVVTIQGAGFLLALGGSALAAGIFLLCHNAGKEDHR